MLSFWFYVFVIGAYFLASLPFGLLLGYVFGLGDIRDKGSGNIGATNVLRVGGKLPAFLVLFLDFAKGVPFIIVNYAMGGDSFEAVILAIASVLGHIFPIWLRFRGGKGVATGIGALFAVNFFMGMGLGLVWLVIFGIFRISSLSSILAFMSLLVWGYFLDGDLRVILALLVLVILILSRHWDNMGRLLRGEEERLSLRR